MHTIIEAFHVLPLYLIVLLFSVQFLWKLWKKQTIIIQQMDPLLLILSAIGTAAGANAHGTHLAHDIFDPCLGYAVVSMCIAARMLGLMKKLKHANA